MSTPAQEHYSSSDIVTRILAAIPGSVYDGVALKANQLFPFDQVPGRELLATIDHATRLNAENGAHLLDVSSEIGAPARYFVSTLDCRVTGVDLTSDFVAAANDLTSRCNLTDPVQFIQTDATSMPFEADTFDHAHCLYVGMNLPDKPSVQYECFRVLKPGATLIWTEVTSVSGIPHETLPWSRTAQDSRVGNSKKLTFQISSAGFDVLAVEDETDAHLEMASRMRESGKSPTVNQVQANEMVFGPDLVDRRQNYTKGLKKKNITRTLIVARKPKAGIAN